MTLTEAGLAMQEVAVNEKSTEVIVMTVTQDAAFTASAVVTEDGAVYEVAGATKDAAFLEAGVVTKEGAVIVDESPPRKGKLQRLPLSSPRRKKELPAKAEDTETKADPA